MTKGGNTIARGISLAVAGVLVAAALMTPAGAHVSGRFKHLWTKHIVPKLSAEGTINDPKNPVDWTKLKGVPEGFADGVDDGDGNSGGDITSVTAGQGLTGGGETGDVELEADFGAVQQKITGTCSGDESVGGVSSTGTLACDPDEPAAFSTSNDPEQGLTTSFKQVAGLLVPPGDYLATAKLTADDQPGGGEGEWLVDCILESGASTDTSRAGGKGKFESTPMSLTLVHRFAPAGGLIRLRCREIASFDEATIRNVKLTAIRVSLP